jgi:hypothetical protein
MSSFRSDFLAMQNAAFYLDRVEKQGKREVCPGQSHEHPLPLHLHAEQVCTIEVRICGDESSHLDAAFAREGIETNEIDRHRNRYNTPHHTSYKSTVRGFVRLRALSNSARISSNASRLTSLGYLVSLIAPLPLLAHLGFSTPQSTP